MSPSKDMAAFKELLSSSKHIIAVAGAGLSAASGRFTLSTSQVEMCAETASGIPTFRGSGGLWRKYDATSLASYSAFKTNPSRVWQFYHYRREKLAAPTILTHLHLSSLTSQCLSSQGPRRQS